MPRPIRVGLVLDLHAHLGAFNPFALKGLWDGWTANGVGWMVGVGVDVPMSEAAIDAAWSLADTVAGVGLHPTRIPSGAASAQDVEEIGVLAELATDPQVAVISDCGIHEAAE